MAQAPPDDGEDPFGDALRRDETLADAFYVDEAAVGVTDHRLLVRQDGRTRAVDLTNVRTVRQRTLQDRGRLTAAAGWGVVVLVLVGGWLLAPLESLAVPVEAPPGTGFDALFAAVDTLVGYLTYLDEAFLVGGVVAVAVVAWHVATFLRNRREVLEIEVAGMDPIHLPPPRDSTAVDRLRGTVDAQAAGDAE